MVKVVTGWKRLEYRILVVFWVAFVLFFWQWWFEPAHIGQPVLYWLVSLSLLYVSTVMPSFYLFFLGQMAKPRPANAGYALKHGVVGKVAVIKLMVPGSEGLELLTPQLIAMAEVKRVTEQKGFSVDLWLLVDKKHVSEIEALASRYGVMYFCRHDVESWGEKVKAWNAPVPPFKAKTKAGNVNSWLDAYGSQYSHFVQLDFDHLPHRNYLLHTLGYFVDPKVKWVQAPSLYANYENGWCARGASEQELVLQGPLQMGFYGFSKTPMIIGSHCTYDTKAIMEIGGFQPTRAEDHLDTVFLAAKGYEGVFLPKPIATGDGPETFETYCAQQFAWAYSMFQVLFQFTPKMVWTMRPKAAVQFLFAETWYLLISLSFLVLTLLTPISLVTNTEISHVQWLDYVLHSMPLTVLGFVIWKWSREWHQPRGIGLTWRGVILHVARWPIVLSALIQVVLNVQKPYMITPKGIHSAKDKPFYLRSFAPYFALFLAMIGGCWFNVAAIGRGATQGYMLYALWGALIFAEVFAVSLAMNLAEMRKAGVKLYRALLLRSKAIFVLLALAVVLGFTTHVSALRIWEAIATSSTIETKGIENEQAVDSGGRVVLDAGFSDRR